jgi:Uma2 family endonuclease
MAEAADLAPVSLDAFLHWEERQEERFERVSGVVRMMAGGTLTHDTISLNVTSALRSALRGGPCRAQGSNLKVVSPRGDVMYPDAFVRCGPAAGGATFVDDPVIVVEVLSLGTAQYDLTRKRLAYKTIPSLRAILYVHPDRARIDIVRRDADGRWDDDAPAEGLDAALALPEIGARLALGEVYEGVEVLEGEPHPPRQARS